LGYISNISVIEDFSFDQSADDPKDLIGFHNEFHKADRLAQQNRLADVRTLTERLIKQRPGFYRLYELGLGTALDQKDYRAAIRYGEKAIALKPGRFRSYYNLGQAYFMNKQKEAAARQFDLVLKYMLKDQTASPTERIQVHNTLGVLHAKQKEYDQALVQFKESLKVNSNQPDILNTLAWTLLTCPNQAFRDPRGALELAKKACGLTQSQHPQYMNTLAVAYATLGNLSEAIKTSEKALTLARAKGDRALVTKLQKQLDWIKKTFAESK
jgi:tetratricopeptide (TPR) repeat protein